MATVGSAARSRHVMRKVGIPMLLLLTLPMAMPPAQAHKGAHGVIKERMKEMTRMEKSLRPINAMLKGKRPFDAEAVHEQGRRILRHAERIPQLFPQGSLKPPSEASPGIWQNFDDFRHRADELKRAALLLMEASAATLPDVARQVQATCKGCHEKYRIEKD